MMQFYTISSCGLQFADEEFVNRKRRKTNLKVQPNLADTLLSVHDFL